MKTVICGNSNSILLDGWLPAFKAASPTIETMNLSLGGSRSPAMLYQILNNTSQLEDVGSAIIEPTVLDCGELAGTGDDVAGQAAALLTTILSKSIAATVLALPRFPRHVDEPSPGMLAWASVAASLGVGVFDGSFVIKQLATHLRKPNDQFWRDAHGHHSPAAGRLIGIILADFHADRKNRTVLTANSSGKAPGANWRVLTGTELASANSLPSRQSSSALMTVNCVVMRAGNALQCAISVDEKVLGVAINYGEMEPRKDVIIEVLGSSGSRQMNVNHHLLPEQVTHKTAVLFRATNFPKGFGTVTLKSCPENARFEPGQDQRMEIAGLLVGKEIKPIAGWETSGRAALAESQDFIISRIRHLLTSRPELFI